MVPIHDLWREVFQRVIQSVLQHKRVGSTEFSSNEAPQHRPGQMGDERRQSLSDASLSALSFLLP